MKKGFCIVIALGMISCAPVLRKDVMEVAHRDIPYADIVRSEEAYRGRLYAFGGIIVSTKAAAEGSLLEMIYIPVDAKGRHLDLEPTTWRLLALYPLEKGFLDPAIYGKNRQVTVAGTLKELRTDRIDEMDYTYPLFEITDIYLWPEEKLYYSPPFYPYGYDPYAPYWWRDPWWRYRHPYPWYPYW